MSRTILACLAGLAGLGMTTSASAQPIGTFRWQLQPYCNVVTVAVTQVGGVYRVEGTDDHCGASTAGSAIGTAFVNPNGSIGLGINIVAAPGGAPVPVDATISLASLGGTWRDSGGHLGAFVFTPGAGTGGSPRPPASALGGVTVGTGLRLVGTAGSETLLIDASTVRDLVSVRTPSFGSLGLGNGAMTVVASDGFDNTAFGDGALRHTTTGDANTGLGYSAAEATTTGSGNTAVGAFALDANNGGDENTAVGYAALGNNVVSHGNTAVGRNTLPSLVFGNYNIGIGFNTGIGLQAGSNNIYIGASGVNLDNYTTRISVTNSAYRTFIGGIRGITTAAANAVPVVIDSAGQLGTISSSRRYKQDIEDLGAAGDAVLRLRPVQFRYQKPFADGGQPLQYGLIAEEVADVLPELVAYDDERRPETVMYQALPTLLLAQVRRLEQERAGMAEQLQTLNDQHRQLLNELADLRATSALDAAAMRARLDRLEAMLSPR